MIIIIQKAQSLPECKSKRYDDAIKSLIYLFNLLQFHAINRIRCYCPQSDNFGENLKKIGILPFINISS